MEWITDPTVWVGLLTLIALEIVLRDNLGLVTRTDLLEAIAGEFPDEGELDPGRDKRES